MMTDGHICAFGCLATCTSCPAHGRIRTCEYTLFERRTIHLRPAPQHEHYHLAEGRGRGGAGK